MRPFLVLMSLVNVAIAAMSGYFAMRAPFVFDTGGAGVDAPVPFGAVAVYPVFCLIAAALPLVLHVRGQTRPALVLSLLPGLIALGVFMIVRT